MGNIVVLDALASYAKTANPVHISNLVMAAPDVDKDQFITLAPEAKQIVSGMTLYASSTDRALAASRLLAAGIPRAGDVPIDGPIVLPFLETIDVSALGGELLGLNHNTFASTRSVMNDIRLLLLGLKSPRLGDIRGSPDGLIPPRFWRYIP